MPGPAVAYRTARPGDAAAVRAVALASWPATYEGLYEPDVIADFLARHYDLARLEAQIARLPETPNVRFEVAELRDQIVGFLQGGWQDGRARVSRLYLHPDAWRIGIGGRLLERFEAEARAAGAASLAVECHWGNTVGLGFYARHRLRRDESAPEDGPEWWLVKRL